MGGRPQFRTPVAVAPGGTGGAPQGTWSLTDPARTIATRSGPTAPGPTATSWASRSKRSSTRPCAPSRAARPRWSWSWGARPERGPCDGGEEVDTESLPPDTTVTRPPDFVAPIEISAGIVWPPVQQYALIENALAHHEQQGIAAHRQDVGALWSRFNGVAQQNPLAAFPLPRSADDIATPGLRTARWPIPTTSGTPANGPSTRPPHSCSARRTGRRPRACHRIGGSSRTWACTCPRQSP